MTTPSEHKPTAERKLRVLVVDNNPIDCSDHMEALKEWGYDPIAAEGKGRRLIEDAKRKAREQRCHAALVDMRLYDDHDVSDRSGLELVQHIKVAKCVVVTGYGSLPTSRKAREYGAVMIGKEEGTEALQLALAEALQDVRRSDFLIDPPDFLEKHVVPYLQSDEHQPVQADEVRDVLMMLYPQEAKITLQDLSRGIPSTPLTESGLHGSSAVVRVTPYGRASAIIKFASPNAIRRECKNYDAYIEGRFKNRRHPHMSKRKRFWNVGAVVYTSLGEDINDIAQFQTYCRNHTPAEISVALRDFFFAVWHPLYTDQSDLPTSLFEVYDRLWSQHDSEGPLSAKLDDWKRLDKFRSFEGLQGEFLEPRRWLADHTADSSLPNIRQCIVHGDLHGRNFFVDKYGNTWVIDFERTGPGHILADFVELEHDLLRELASDLDLPTLFQLLKGLVTPLSISRTSKDDPLHLATVIPALVESVDESRRARIEKGLQTIYELRKIAVELFNYEDQREYYWAFLLDTLFCVQRLERQNKLTAPDEVIRKRELLIASIICQRLKGGQSEWPPKWAQLSQTHRTTAATAQGANTKQVSELIKILFLAANPSDTARLQIDKEYRGIREALQKAGKGERFTLSNELAVRVSELIDLLVQRKPTVVHFSGHGSEEGEIILEDESGDSFPLPQKAVQKIFGVLNRNGNQVRCVILNACFTEQQAHYLTEYVDIVVGIASEIGDTSAIKFASTFYASVGEGESVQTAFDLACVNIELHGLDFHDALRLVTKKGINPNDYYLATPGN